MMANRLLLAFLLLSAVGAAWWDTSWTYRTPINLTTAASVGNLSGYATLILVNASTLISAGKMQADCDDLRFVNASDNAAGLLPYWIENESSCNSLNLRVWVNVTAITNGTASTVYMYYGNPAASNYSYGDTVFPFFDSFNGASINSSKWNATGTWAANGGMARSNASDISKLVAYTGAKGYFYNQVVDIRARSNTLTKDDIYLGGSNSTTYHAYAGATALYWFSAYGKGSAYQTWNTYEFRNNMSNVSAWMNGTFMTVAPASMGAYPTPHTGFIIGYNASIAHDFDVDWIYKRDYVNVEPNVTYSAEGTFSGANTTVNFYISEGAPSCGIRRPLSGINCSIGGVNCASTATQVQQNASLSTVTYYLPNPTTSISTMGTGAGNSLGITFFSSTGAKAFVINGNATEFRRDIIVHANPPVPLDDLVNYTYGQGSIAMLPALFASDNDYQLEIIIGRTTDAISAASFYHYCSNYTKSTGLFATASHYTNNASSACNITGSTFTPFPLTLNGGVYPGLTTYSVPIYYGIYVHNASNLTMSYAETQPSANYTYYSSGVGTCAATGVPAGTQAWNCSAPGYYVPIGISMNGSLDVQANSTYAVTIDSVQETISQTGVITVYDNGTAASSAYCTFGGTNYYANSSGECSLPGLAPEQVNSAQVFYLGRSVNVSIWAGDMYNSQVYKPAYTSADTCSAYHSTGISRASVDFASSNVGLFVWVMYDNAGTMTPIPNALVEINKAPVILTNYRSGYTAATTIPAYGMIAGGVDLNVPYSALPQRITVTATCYQTLDTYFETPSANGNFTFIAVLQQASGCSGGNATAGTGDVESFIAGLATAQAVSALSILVIILAIFAVTREPMIAFMAGSVWTVILSLGQLLPFSYAVVMFMLTLMYMAVHLIAGRKG